jgi:endonuclease YncB( thermonuclease family)
MFLGLNSGNHQGRIAGASLAAAGFALGILAAATVRPVQSTGVSSPATAVRPFSAPGSTAVPPGYPAEVIRVLDGDTFEARVRVWPGMDITTKVRLRGIDAPEMRARCAEERIKAEAARDALSSLLARGQVGISGVGLDKYGGRVLAEASARQTANVAEALLAGGHVRRYGGGRRESWCSGQRY